MLRVIFDLDGTLANTRAPIAASINRVRRELYGLSPLCELQIMQILDGAEGEIAAALYGTRGYEPEAQALFEEDYARRCVEEAVLFEGVEAMLARLKEAGARLFIATNAPTHTSRLILRRCGIEAYFDDIAGADRVRRPKPDPEMLRLHLKDSSDAAAWMVGDSRKDMAAAAAAGVRGIFAGWGYGRALEESAYHIEANDPAEVVSAILGN